MSFLKDFGKIASKALGIAGQLTPVAGTIITAVAPGSKAATVTNEIGAITSLILQAEVMGQALNLKGPDKLKAVTPMVSATIRSLPPFAGKKISDPAKFDAAVAQIASSVADLLNAVEGEATTT